MAYTRFHGSQVAGRATTVAPSTPTLTPTPSVSTVSGPAGPTTSACRDEGSARPAIAQGTRSVSVRPSTCHRCRLS